MIGKALKWLTDPSAIGRKRTVAAIAAVVAGMLRGAETALRAACDAADFVGSVCSFQPGNVAGALEGLAQWLNAVVVPGADAVTVIMGLWGLWAARKKKAIVVASMLFLALATPALAQDKEFNLFDYLRSHAYVSGGPLVLDGENHTVYEVRLVDDFQISADFRGAARVSLFSLTRAGEQAPPPKIPTTLKEASEAYSDGEVWLSVYRVIKPWLAVECIGGLTFKMASISGSKGDPLDGTKAAFGCGPRFSYRRNHVSLIPSHYGPVADKGKLLGPAPSLLVHAHIPLTFLGKNTAFTPDLAFGATAPAPSDPDKRRNITKALRLLVSARF